MDGVELARDRVREDHRAALAHERDALVEVEEVAEPHAHDEDRVEDRVDVVRADVGQPGGDDVGLPARVISSAGPAAPAPPPATKWGGGVWGSPPRRIFGLMRSVVRFRPAKVA